MDYNFKYKVRFFRDIEEECFAQYNDSVIPQINTNVYVCGKEYFVENICTDYGYPDEENKFELIDVTVTTIDGED